MNDWSDGYVNEVTYTHGYYSELNPNRVKLAFLASGMEPPNIATACELGFGQGLSTNIHAATSTVEWYGTDINPSHALFAQQVSTKSGNNARLFDESFEEFCNRTDLPDFDFIAMHGIWSWISNNNRHQIVDFLRKKLKVGGVLYISYNTLPGWSSHAPIRHFMTQHYETYGSIGNGLLKNIDHAIDAAGSLAELKSKYVKDSIGSEKKISSLKTQNREYLAHEYFNKDWAPMYFSDVSDWLHGAKLDFACSANLLDQIDILNFTEDQISYLNGITDPNFKETVKDFIINQQFRKDYWVRGKLNVSHMDRMNRLKNLKFILIVNRDDIPKKVSGHLVEAQLQESIYTPILDVLADHKAHKFESLLYSLEENPSSLEKLLQALHILCALGAVSIIGTETHQLKVSQRLNEEIINISKSSSTINFLAASNAECGVPVPRFSQLFILAIWNNRKSETEIAQYVWDIFSAQGQNIIVDGKPLTTVEENLSELKKRAKKFLNFELARLQKIGVL